LVCEEIRGSRSLGLGAPGGAWVVDIVSFARHKATSMPQCDHAKTLLLQQKAVRTKCNCLLVVNIVDLDAWPEPRIPHGHES
jgi:hypothetical protein